MGIRGSCVALAAVAISVVAGCGGSESDEDAAPAPTTSTTAKVAAAAPLVYRTELGVPAPQDAVVVSMKGFTYHPATLQATGPTVTFALSNEETLCSGPNCEEEAYDHDLRVLDPATGMAIARSELLAPGESGLFIVEGMQAGTYRFICSLHSNGGMNGTLEVTG
jgi:plastocyanin